MAVLLCGEALALILALAPGQPEGSRLVQFGLASLAVQWVGLGTLGLLWLAHKPLSRLNRVWLAWVCLACLLAMTLLVSLLAWEAMTFPHGLQQPKVEFVLRMLALALVVGLMGLMAFENYWKARQLALRTKQLELEALRARIRPHFLFNTLNTGAALVHARPDEAERVLLDLAELFRAALRGPELVPLAEELDLTRRYLEIESLRFGERLQVVWSLPAAMPDVLVPSLSIQPLAENAIRHGIEGHAGTGRVDLALQVTAREVWIDVMNDVAEGGVSIPGHAVGLASVRERVHALSRGRGALEVDRAQGRFRARIRLPVEPLPPYPTTS